MNLAYTCMHAKIRTLHLIIIFNHMYFIIFVLPPQVQPQHPDGSVIGDLKYVRTGLLGFLGPVSVCDCSRQLLLVEFLFSILLGVWPL